MSDFQLALVCMAFVSTAAITSLALGMILMDHFLQQLQIKDKNES